MDLSNPDGLPQTPVKVAVVGAGGWGQQHLRVFSTLPGSRVCAVVSRNLDRARGRASSVGARAYHSIDEMIGAEHPDLVTLSLPNEAHFEPTLQVIQAGVPLLTEKPLVFDLTEAATLLSAAAERKLFFAINFNHRYSEPVRRAKVAIEEGSLGDVVFASWRFGGEPGKSNHPHANLIETQCHGFDLLEHLCGPISSVMAQMTNKTQGVFTTMVVALEFASGGVGSLIGTYDSSYAYSPAHYLEINGTEGRVEVYDTVKRFVFSRRADESRQVWEPGYFNDVDRQFERTFDKHATVLLDALGSRGEPPVHARAGRRALELAYAVIESFEGGQRVSTGESG